MQIFEKSEVKGCSNTHPHEQTWTSSVPPNGAVGGDQMQLAWIRQHGTPLLLDYARKKRELGETDYL